MASVNMYKMYMAVTPDELELPLAVADSLEELAEITGFAKSSISCSLSRNRSGTKHGVKFVRVQIMYDNYEW